MKKMKLNNLFENPQEEQISSEDNLHYKRTLAFEIKPESLCLQRIKRKKATRWNFHLPKDKEDQETTSKSFGQALQLDKSTYELLIHFPPSFKDQDLLNLAHGLKRLKSLQRVTFKVFNYQWVPGPGLDRFMKGLTRLCQLKKFLLEICISEQLSDVSLDYVTRSLKKMVSLKEISLQMLMLPQITGKGLGKLYGSLNHLVQLENVYLLVESCPEITDKSVARMNLKRLIRLRQVFLRFRYCELSDTGVFMMARALKNLFLLERFELELVGCSEFGDVSLLCLWEMMNSLPSLQAITLVFWECLRITNAGLKDMNQNLKGLALLKELSFEFYCCPKITDKGLGYLCKALVERAVTLESLSVFFAGCSEITDFGIKRVIDCMKNLTHLKEIGIDISQFTQVTEASWSYFCEFLKSHKTCLKKVTLRLDEIEGVNDEEEEIENLKILRPDLEILSRDT